MSVLKIAAGYYLVCQAVGLLLLVAVGVAMCSEAKSSNAEEQPVEIQASHTPAQ